MTYIEDVQDAIRAADDARPRSQQVGLGVSGLNGCLLHIAYTLLGEWPSDPDYDRWRAVIGTVLHEHLVAVRTRPDRIHDWEVSYRGVPGHPDEIEVMPGRRATVTEWKFPTVASAHAWKSDADAFLAPRAQVHAYAAGFADAEELNDEDVCARVLVAPVDAGFDAWWAVEEPLDRSLADASVDRLERVQGMLDGGELPRCTKPTYWCERFCEFYSLRSSREDYPPDAEITDPELATLIEQHGLLGEDIAPKVKLRKKIAAELAGLRGTARGWRVYMTRPSGTKLVTDEAAVRAALAELGQDVPTVAVPSSTPSLRVDRVRPSSPAKESP